MPSSVHAVMYVMYHAAAMLYLKPIVVHVRCSDVVCTFKIDDEIDGQRCRPAECSTYMHVLEGIRKEEKREQKSRKGKSSSSSIQQRQQLAAAAAAGEQQQKIAED